MILDSPIRLGSVLMLTIWMAIGATAPLNARAQDDSILWTFDADG